MLQQVFEDFAITQKPSFLVVVGGGDKYTILEGLFTGSSNISSKIRVIGVMSKNAIAAYRPQLQMYLLSHLLEELLHIWLRAFSGDYTQIYTPDLLYLPQLKKFFGLNLKISLCQEFQIQPEIFLE